MSTAATIAATITPQQQQEPITGSIGASGLDTICRQGNSDHLAPPN